MRIVSKQKPLKKRAEYRKIALKTCDSDNLMPYKSKRAIGAFKRVLCDFGFFKFLSQGIYFFCFDERWCRGGASCICQRKKF